MHKIPKASDLKIKTLTAKNLESDKMIESIKVNQFKPFIKNNGLDFFKQFNTIKELIEFK